MKRVGVVVLAVLCTAFLAQAQVEKVGVDVLKSYETPHPYPAAQEGSSDLVWRDVITFAGATYIAPHFSRFHLADNDYVIVRSPDNSRSWRYEKLGKANLGESADGFWGIHITGDTAIIELHGKIGNQFGYRIDRFARGYRPEEMAPFGPESICGIDNSDWAKCYQVTEPDIYDNARAVARLLIQGSSACTGWLIGNAGHLMTNFHCIGSAADALNTDYEFMAEGATCATDCSAQLSCPGTIVSTSATAVQLDQPLDYALVLLPVNPTATYGFLKLRTGPAFVDERIYLPGHPAIKGKKIAVNSTDATDQSGFCEIRDFAQNPAIACIPSATQLDTGYHCDTEGGSSGTPVIAYSDHKVVALHHCGGCPNSGVQISNVITSLGANVPPGSTFEPAGTVKLDKDKYGCSATVSIEVQDDNLIGAGTQSVTIDSTTETLDETVVLTETPASSGTFVGTITTTTAAAANGDGLLSVAHGDTITVTYNDLDDGTGNPAVRTDTALVDCIAPVITNVQAINVTGNSADILWDTNEPADSLVTYGLSASPPPTSTTSVGTLVTSHSVHLTGLLACRSHIYKVASSDAAGNSAQDDNGGSYYAFTTGANTNPTYTSTSVPVSIPDNNPAGASATISVTDSNPIVDLNVRVKVTHTFDGDLIFTLTSPSSQAITLINRRGSNGVNFNDTVLDDQAATAISAGTAPFAGSYRPEQALSAYNGQAPTGTWTLKVVDAAGLDVGTVDKFELIFTYPAQPCGPYLRHLSHTNPDTCNGTGTGSGDGVIDPGEDVSVPVVLANTGTDTASSISATVTSSSPGVTITQGSATYGTLNAGQSGPGSAAYGVRVAESVPCGTLLTFDVAATASEGSWNDSFTLRVGAPASSTTTYNSTDVPKTIPDNVTANSTISVADTGAVTDVNVNLTLTHSYDADIAITLIGPNGALVPLATNRGGSLNDYTNTTFDDSAATPISSGTAPFNGTFRPESPLSSLNGIPANGTWTLRIVDSAGGDTGTLTAWKVVLTTLSGFTCGSCTPTLAPPGEVVSLSFSAEDTVDWSSTAGATEYRLYRGTLSDLPKLLDATADSCRRATTGSLSQGGIGDNPIPSNFYWWLVRAANAGGEGPSGSATAGQRIQDSTGVCP